MLDSTDKKTEFRANARGKFSAKSIFVQIAAGSLFAGVFYGLQEIVQPFLAGWSSGFCCERCSNILYDQAQPIYAVCAGIAFLSVSSIQLNGWKSVFKTMFIGFLCFQFDTALTLLSAMRGAECSALIFPRGLPVAAGAIFLLIEGCLWSLLCAVPILIFKFVLSKRNLSE